MGPDPRYRHQSRSLFVLARAGIEIRLQASDLLLELADLNEQKPAQLPDRLRQHRVRILHCPRQPADVGRPLRSCDAVLRQVTSQSVDRLRTLTHQQIPRAEQHPPGLLLFGLHRTLGSCRIVGATPGCAQRSCTRRVKGSGTVPPEWGSQTPCVTANLTPAASHPACRRACATAASDPTRSSMRSAIRCAGSRSCSTVQSAA